MVTVAEKWEHYKKAVLPDDAGPVQVLECERAFYAGACGFFDCLSQIPTSNDPGTGIESFQKLRKELLDYAEGVRNV